MHFSSPFRAQRRWSPPRELSRRPLASGRAALAVAVFGWLLLGLLVRLPLLSHESGDFRDFVGVWLATLEREGFSAFATPFADYAPAYLYLLWALSKLPIDGLIATKALSIGFDVVLAAAVAALGRAHGLSARRAVTAFGMVFVLPTVVLNSAAWAQCDAIYAAAVVAALVLASRGRGSWAMVAVGVGIAFKAQAAFVLPFLLVLTLRREIRWRDWLALPVPYLVAAVPAALAGRPLVDILTVYVSQTEKYRELTLNAPTVYAWLDLAQSRGTPGIAVGGLGIGAAALLAARYASLRTGAERLALVTFLFVLIPFVLPRMHDRYFFLADVTATLYAVLRPSRWFVPVLVVGASTASYFPFLFGFEPVPLPMAAMLMAAALIVLGADVFPMAKLSPWRFRWAPPAWVPVAAQFACVGIGSTLLFLVIYAGLRRALEPATANATALMLTMVLNFAANRYSSFRKRRHSLRAEFPLYLAIYFIGLGASVLAFHLAWSALGSATTPVTELLLVLGTGGVGTALRFVLLTRFVYRERGGSRVRGAADAKVPRVAAAGSAQHSVMSPRD